VLDVGANRGYYTKFFSHKVGRNGRVCAFEPVPESADTLRVQCSHRRNVDIFQLALSDEAGRRKIFVPGDDLQQASLVRQAGGSWRKCDRVFEHEIEVVTLDSWVAQQGLNRVDFIKLDVEGAEYKVLRGGEETIKRFRPLIYMEVCRDWVKGFGFELSDLVRELAKLGYTYVYQPTIKNKQFRLSPVDLMSVENGDVLVSWRAI